jgi:hypothetical protein
MSKTASTAGFDRTKILVTTHPTTRYLVLDHPVQQRRCSVGVVAARRISTAATSTSTPACAVSSTRPQPVRRAENAVWDTPARTIGGYSANVKTLHGPGFALLLRNSSTRCSSGVTIAMRSASMAAASCTGSSR